MENLSSTGSLNLLKLIKISNKTYGVFKNPNSYGSEIFYKLANNISKEIVYTEGVRDFFIKNEAYWFRDIISSYRNEIFNSNEDFFSVHLVLHPEDDSQGYFIMTDGNENILIKQHIPYVSLAANVQFFLEFDSCSRYTLMLPSER